MHLEDAAFVCRSSIHGVLHFLLSKSACEPRLLLYFIASRKQCWQELEGLTG